jgi:hypothetical protein
MSCIEGLPLFARWSHSSQGLYNNAAIPYNDPEWSIWREELSTELGRYKGELPFLLLNYAGQVCLIRFITNLLFLDYVLPEPQVHL